MILKNYVQFYVKLSLKSSYLEEIVDVLKCFLKFSKY
jgi:hypothetical protein